MPSQEKFSCFHSRLSDWPNCSKRILHAEEEFPLVAPTFLTIANSAWHTAKLLLGFFDEVL